MDDAIQKIHIKEGMFDNVISKYFAIQQFMHCLEKDKILDTMNFCICSVWSIGKQVGSVLGCILHVLRR